MVVKDVRENFVKLWAQIIKKEIVQTNFWFFVQYLTESGKKRSNWVDIDVVGSIPGSNTISLYNVKSNLNTGKGGETPEKISDNFYKGIKILNKSFDENLKYNLYLIYENADRFGKRDNFTILEFRERIKEKKEAYKKEILNNLIKKGIKEINYLIVQDLHQCIQDLIHKKTQSPTGPGSYCYQFNDNVYVYPFSKIPELQFLNIYKDYDFEES